MRSFEGATISAVQCRAGQGRGEDLHRPPKGEDITPEMGGRGHYILHLEDWTLMGLYLFGVNPEKLVRLLQTP